MTALKVIGPGGASSIQDLGRPGYGRYGVSEAGAMDRMALQLANHLVGNDPGEACVEFAMVGGRYAVLDGDCRIAVAGSDFDIALDGVALPTHRSAYVRQGSVITIGSTRTGVYGYLAVESGFDLPEVLGSRSIHLRSGIGGAPLAPGALLRLRQDVPRAGPERGLGRVPRDRAGAPIRVVWGPQDDCFTERGRAEFLGGDYTVTLQSDRMGYRLDGPPIEHRSGFNIVSDGIVFGSIQVPGTGQPIVLLADRQTTGGYPKIATVISADIPRLVQRRPGATVRFTAVTIEEALSILEQEVAAFAALCGDCRPVSTGDILRSERLLSLNLVDGFTDGGN